LHLTDGRDSYDLAPHVEIFEDPSAALTIRDVSAPQFSSNFVLLGGTLDEGMSSSAYWLRVRLLNETSHQAWLLALDNPDLEWVDFYGPATGSRAGRSVRTGALAPLSTRDVSNPRLLFKLRPPTGLEETYYLRIAGRTLLTTRLSVQSEGAYASADRSRLMIDALLYGVLATVCGLSITSFIGLRKPGYLAYAAFLLTFGLTLLQDDGLGAFFLWPAHPEWTPYLRQTLRALAAFFAVVFIMVTLRTRQNDRRAHRVLLAFAVLWMLRVCCLPLAVDLSLGRLDLILLVATILAIVGTAVLRWCDGCRTAGGLLAGCFLPCATIAAALLVDIGLLPRLWPTETLYKAAGVPLVLVLSFALRDQVEAGRQLNQATESIARERERLLRAIVDNSTAVVYVKDIAGRYQLVNRQFEERFGVTEAAARGRTDLEILPPAIAEQFHCRDLVALNGDGARQDEETVPQPNGVRTYLSVCFPLRDDAGNTYGVAGAKTDVTELRALREQLVASHKFEAIGRLAGGVAHDFNNLMAVITGGVFAAREAIRGGESPDEMLRDVEDAGHRAAALTRRLMGIASRQPGEPQCLDLNALLLGMEALFRRVLGSRIELAMTLSEGAALTWIDATQLEQVLINLVVNARDAMPNGGRLLIATRVAHTADGLAGSQHASASRHVVLRVSDNGVGMPPHVRARLFEPFFTTKPPGQGTGLGLATTLGIVKQAGGDVRVDSMEGVGTTFSVFLPEAGHGALTVVSRTAESSEQPAVAGSGL
jgi:PAS domain S-box-containing protein